VKNCGESRSPLARARLLRPSPAQCKRSPDNLSAGTTPTPVNLDVLAARRAGKKTSNIWAGRDLDVWRVHADFAKGEFRFHSPPQAVVHLGFAEPYHQARPRAARHTPRASRLCRGERDLSHAYLGRCAGVCGRVGRGARRGPPMPRETLGCTAQSIVGRCSAYGSRPESRSRQHRASTGVFTDTGRVLSSRGELRADLCREAHKHSADAGFTLATRPHAHGCHANRQASGSVASGVKMSGTRRACRF